MSNGYFRQKPVVPAPSFLNRKLNFASPITWDDSQIKKVDLQHVRVINFSVAITINLTITFPFIILPPSFHHSLNEDINRYQAQPSPSLQIHQETSCSGNNSLLAFKRTCYGLLELPIAPPHPSSAPPHRTTRTPSHSQTAKS